MVVETGFEPIPLSHKESTVLPLQHSTKSRALPLGDSAKMAAKPLEKILTFHLAALSTTIISDKIWRLSFYCMYSICSNVFPLMKTKASLKPKPHILSLLE